MNILTRVTALAVVCLLAVTGCGYVKKCEQSGAPGSVGAASGQEAAQAGGQMKTFAGDENLIADVVTQIVAKHGDASKGRAERGVRQAAAYWNENDGAPSEFTAFCLENFVSDDDGLTALLGRFRVAIESINGHAVALTRTLREPVDLATYDSMPVDLLFATLNPFDHLSEDFFTTKIAFVGLLNFPLLDTTTARDLSRREWAEVRLAQTFARRIPGDVALKVTKAYAEAEDYIAKYNVFMGGVVNQDGSKPFPADLKLISHWGLRDHLKAMYSDPVGNLESQKTILRIMERIVNQEIPVDVINADGVVWNPWINEVTDKDGAKLDNTREADVRYARILEVFHAEQLVDRYSPMYPTHIDRRFKLDREISEERVRQMLETVIGSDTMKKVAELIRQRLGRDLQPFDIWYDGFKNRASLNEEVLNGRVAQKYQCVADFKKDLPQTLGKLGFTPENADYLQQHIEVDPARGAGHAMGAGMHTDSAHLRTRVPDSGMDYKGYNIALHELGHCVEQVFSLNRVDDTLLYGVPNTAFTEAFAFVFQSRDLDVLGDGSDKPSAVDNLAVGGADPMAVAMKTLDLFWSTVEIGSVGLLDMQVWRWMYAHPEATPAELREATVAMAKDLWNKYFAPVFGVKDSPILAIYSHMVAYGLYLPDYSIGFIIQAQIENYIRGKNLATEMERMCVQGRISPDVWMKGAVGSELSPDALLKSTDAALETVAHPAL